MYLCLYVFTCVYFYTLLCLYVVKSTWCDITKMQWISTLNVNCAGARWREAGLSPPLPIAFGCLLALLRFLLFVLVLWQEIFVLAGGLESPCWAWSCVIGKGFCFVASDSKEQKSQRCTWSLNRTWSTWKEHDLISCISINIITPPCYLQNDEVSKGLLVLQQKPGSSEKLRVQWRQKEAGLPCASAKPSCIVFLLCSVCKSHCRRNVQVREPWLRP